MNELDFVVFDLETGGLNPDLNEAIQVAGKAYNARSLEPYPAEQGGEFCSLMKPLYFDRLEPGALRVNRITPEQLKEAPDQKVVWNQFIAWVQRFNPTGGVRKAPIACGKNIRDFDLKFVANLNKLHSKKGDKTVLFNKRRQYDLEDQLFAWFENDPELPDEKMDTVRDYFGMSRDGAHDALVDTRQTGELLMRFLRLFRELRRRVNKEGKPFIQLQGSMKGV